MAGPTAEGIVPESHFTSTRFTLWSPTHGEVPVASIDERPDPTTTLVAQDKTIRTGGETTPQTIGFSIPKGNDAVRLSLHAGVEAGRDNVQPGYREDWILTTFSADGIQLQVETLGMGWLSGRTMPSLDKSGDPVALSDQFQLSYSTLSIQAA